VLAGLVIGLIITSSEFLDRERSRFFAQVISYIGSFGISTIFYLWASTDARAYSRTRWFVLLFAVLWFFALFLSQFGYLLATRGLKRGSLACLKFVGFIALFSGLLYFLLSTLFAQR
jgi:hypothetical protein